MLGKFFGAGRRSQSDESQWPWEPDGSIAAIVAASNLTAYFSDDLNGPRGIHVETLMTMVGAVAGFAAQHAIRETFVKTGKLPEQGGKDLDGGAFVIAETDAGEKFHFGDLLNSYLVPQERGNARFGPSAFTLWRFAATIVEQCGFKPISLDDIGEIFGNAAATVGTALFGSPRLPRDHKPSMTPRSALNRAWPKVKLILGREAAQGGELLPPAHWPALIAFVAAKFILMTKDTLDPSLSMRIIFEAAIPMSKVDPKTVPDGPALQ